MIDIFVLFRFMPVPSEILRDKSVHNSAVKARLVYGVVTLHGNWKVTIMADAHISVSRSEQIVNQLAVHVCFPNS